MLQCQYHMQVILGRTQHPLKFRLSLDFLLPQYHRKLQNLGWEEIFIAKYDKLFYKGKTYGSRLDENNQVTIYMAIRTET